MDKNSEKEVRKGFYYDIMDSNHYVISTKMFRVEICSWNVIQIKNKEELFKIEYKWFFNWNFVQQPHNPCLPDVSFFKSVHIKVTSWGKEWSGTPSNRLLKDKTASNGLINSLKVLFETHFKLCMKNMAYFLLHFNI